MVFARWIADCSTGDLGAVSIGELLKHWYSRFAKEALAEWSWTVELPSDV